MKADNDPQSLTAFGSASQATAPIYKSGVAGTGPRECERYLCHGRSSPIPYTRDTNAPITNQTSHFAVQFTRCTFVHHFLYTFYYTLCYLSSCENILLISRIHAPNFGALDAIGDGREFTHDPTQGTDGG